MTSRAGSRCASPAASVRSRLSRRGKHRTPSPPPPHSSDADSESDSDTRHQPRSRKNDNHIAHRENTNSRNVNKERYDDRVSHSRRNSEQLSPPSETSNEKVERLTVPPPAPSGPWQCEHCTFVNNAGDRVCSVCCRTRTAESKSVSGLTSSVGEISIEDNANSTQMTTQGGNPKRILVITLL